MAGLHGSPLRKPYSIASAPFEAVRDGVIELLIQVEDAGGPDPHLELAELGRAIDVEGPFGNFGLPPAGDGRPLLFVAGGTGIAPLRSMLVEALDRDARAHPSVIYSARAPEELAYREELEALAIDGRLDLFITITRNGPADWSGRRGRIDEIVNFRSEIERRLSRTLERDLKRRLPLLYDEARRNLRRKLERYGEAGIAERLPERCPFTLGQVLGDFWPPSI